MEQTGPRAGLPGPPKNPVTCLGRLLPWLPSIPLGLKASWLGWSLLRAADSPVMAATQLVLLRLEGVCSPGLKRQTRISKKFSISRTHTFRHYPCRRPLLFTTSLLSSPAISHIAACAACACHVVVLLCVHFGFVLLLLKIYFVLVFCLPSPGCVGAA